MKVKFIGFLGKRHHHRDWALEIVTETDFEQDFLCALFDSSDGKQMQPKGALLVKTETGLSVMVDSEDFTESQLAKERQENKD